MPKNQSIFASFLTRSALAVLCLLLTPLVSAQAKVEADLIGTWIGTGFDNEGEKVVVGQNFVLIYDERMPLQAVSAGVLAVGPRGDTERFTYKLERDKLSIRDSDGLTSQWRRVGKKQASRRTDNPLGGGVRNPLGQVRSDPFARTFRGDGMILELKAATIPTYRGLLKFRGQTYPVTARVDGQELSGAFRSENQEFLFTARLTGNRLALTSAGTTYKLQGPAVSNPLASNPLASNPLASKARVAANSKSMIDKTANIACDLPSSWTVTSSAVDGCLINPGYQRGQTVNVSISLHCLSLEEPYRSMSPVKLLQGELAATRKSLLDSSGLRTGDSVRGVQSMTVAGKPAAFVVMPGETARGQTGLVWVALRVDGDKCFACNAIFLAGKDREFLPKVQAVFESMVQASQYHERGPVERSHEDVIEELSIGHEEVEEQMEEVELPSRNSEPLPSRSGLAPARSGTLKLTKRTFRDAGFGGIDSHTMYLPEDWQGDARVVWTNSQVQYVHFVGAFEGPDRTSIGFGPNYVLLNSDNQSSMREHQQQIAADQSGYTMRSWAPGQRGEVAMRIILPRLRPSATNARLVEVKTFPKAVQAMRQQNAPIMQMLRQGHTMEFHAELAYLEYEEGGQLWEEAIQCATTINRVRMRMAYSSAIDITEIGAVRTVRAPKGQLRAKFSELSSISGSLRPTPRWSISLNQLVAEISKMKHRSRMNDIKAFGERAKLIAKTNSEISDSQMKSWWKQQASSDSIQRASINGIAEVHDYTSRDGVPISLDNSYDRVFQDSLGNLILTNDTNTDPTVSDSNWQRLQRIRHLGR